MQSSRKPGVISDPAVDAGFGETRRRRDGKAGRCEEPGKPGTPSAGAKGMGNRGNPITQTQGKAGG